MKAKDLVPIVQTINTYKRYGKVSKVVGLMIESQGPESSIGDVCYIPCRIRYNETENYG